MHIIIPGLSPEHMSHNLVTSGRAIGMPYVQLASYQPDSVTIASAEAALAFWREDAARATAAGREPLPRAVSFAPLGRRSFDLGSTDGDGFNMGTTPELFVRAHVNMVADYSADLADLMLCVKVWQAAGMMPKILHVDSEPNSGPGGTPHDVLQAIWANPLATARMSEELRKSDPIEASKGLDWYKLYGLHFDTIRRNTFQRMFEDAGLLDNNPSVVIEFLHFSWYPEAATVVDGFGTSQALLKMQPHGPNFHSSCEFYQIDKAADAYAALYCTNAVNCACFYPALDEATLVRRLRLPNQEMAFLWIDPSWNHTWWQLGVAERAIATFDKLTSPSPLSA